MRERKLMVECLLTGTENNFSSQTAGINIVLMLDRY